ncbi:hypothetical protein TNCV_985321 [Trichonephila clavipes]|nr:hypothetical protein TNCV_985321 [Trichonephila clavipes]
MKTQQRRYDSMRRTISLVLLLPVARESEQGVKCCVPVGCSVWYWWDLMKFLILPFACDIYTSCCVGVFSAQDVYTRPSKGRLFVRAALFKTSPTALEYNKMSLTVLLKNLLISEKKWGRNLASTPKVAGSTPTQVGGFSRCRKLTMAMSYDYTACKLSLECLFGLDALGKIENPSTGSHRQEFRCFPLARKLGAKIACGN